MTQAQVDRSPAVATAQSSHAASHPGAAPPSQLHMLLDAELEFTPAARGGFVNHLAMTLTAAARLGASDFRLREIFDSHARDGYLVRRELPAWLSGPLPLSTNDRALAVARRVPPLTADIAARWFHAVIRLELALDSAHPGQVENALSDWEQVAEPLSALSAARGTESLLTVVRAMDRSAFAGESTLASLRGAAGHPAVIELVHRAALGESALREAAEFALFAHIARQDFTTLHMITGTRAARAVSAYLGRDEALRLGEHLAHALVAAYVTNGAPPLLAAPQLAELRAQPLPDWRTIATSAIQSEDAHMIKLTYACKLEQAATREPLYQWVAARNAGLL